MEELEEVKTLAETINEVMKIKGITVEKLSQLTGVSDRFIVLLLDEKHEKLPSAPYIHGYLVRIGNTLNINGEELWLKYTKHRTHTIKETKSAFAVSETKPNTLPLFAIGGAITLAIIAFTFRAPAFLGTPTLSLEDFSETATSTSIDIKGKIDPKNQLTINNEVVYPDERGTFEKKVTLAPGFNTFRFSVKGILGKEFEITKQVYFATTTKNAEQKITTITE